MRIRDWLDLAIAIEKRSAELYGQFSVLFKDHKELTEYWGQMKADEERHESILNEVIANLEDDDGNRTINAVKSEKTTRLLSCINDDLSKVFSNLDDAYECAHELEEKEVEVIFDLLRDDSINQYEGVHTLLKEDQEHLQKLIDFNNTFGKAEWRKIIQAGKEQ